MKRLIDESEDAYRVQLEDQRNRSPEAFRKKLEKKISEFACSDALNRRLHEACQTAEGAFRQLRNLIRSESGQIPEPFGGFAFSGEGTGYYPQICSMMSRLQQEIEKLPEQIGFPDLGLLKQEIRTAHTGLCECESVMELLQNPANGEQNGFSDCLKTVRKEQAALDCILKNFGTAYGQVQGFFQQDLPKFLRELGKAADTAHQGASVRLGEVLTLTGNFTYVLEQLADCMRQAAMQMEKIRT